jgi:hypothetical protein
MGLKGYRLWVMGQLDSNVHSPTAASAAFNFFTSCCSAPRSASNGVVPPEGGLLWPPAPEGGGLGLGAVAARMPPTAAGVPCSW